MGVGGITVRPWPDSPPCDICSEPVEVRARIWTPSTPLRCWSKITGFMGTAWRRRVGRHPNRSDSRESFLELPARTHGADRRLEPGACTTTAIGEIAPIQQVGASKTNNSTPVTGTHLLDGSY